MAENKVKNFHNAVATPQISSLHEATTTLIADIEKELKEHIIAEIKRRNGPKVAEYVKKKLVLEAEIKEAYVDSPFYKMILKASSEAPSPIAAEANAALTEITKRFNRGTNPPLSIEINDLRRKHKNACQLLAILTDNTQTPANKVTKFCTEFEKQKKYYPFKERPDTSWANFLKKISAVLSFFNFNTSFQKHTSGRIFEKNVRATLNPDKPQKNFAQKLFKGNKNKKPEIANQGMPMRSDRKK